MAVQINYAERKFPDHTLTARKKHFKGFLYKYLFIFTKVRSANSRLIAEINISEELGKGLGQGLSKREPKVYIYLPDHRNSVFKAKSNHSLCKSQKTFLILEEKNQQFGDLL